MTVSRTVLTGSNLRPGELLALLSAATLFIVLRLLGWLNAPELENHDSVGYLEWANVFRSADWHEIAGLSPDAAPLYPLLTALFSLFPGDMEAAARLVSLLSSIATMVAVYLIAKRAGNHKHLCGVLAIVLLAVSSEFFRMSYSVLTEPLYIALFTWIVFIFLLTVDKPNLKRGIALGVLCGLAFLTRVEAVLLLALPLLHVLFFAVSDERKHSVTSVAYPNLALVLLMAILAAPQIVRVSVQMNSFALNGRSAWTLILSNPDGKTYDEKLSGLDYDPKVMNLEYLQSRPQALQAMVQDAGYGAMLKSFAVTATRNVRHMHDRQLVALVGLPLVVFAVIGFLAILRSGRGADAWLLGAFMAIALTAPVLYHVTLRHLLIIVPLLCILASRGIVDAAKAIATPLFGGRNWRKTALFACLAIASLIPAGQTAQYILQPDTVNREYAEESLRAPATLVRRFSEDLVRPPKIMARKTYLAHLSGSSSDLPPYTDLAGLLTYIEGRQVDFLFYEQEHLGEYPFAAQVESEAWRRHFRTIWSRGERETEQVLYAVR